MTYAQYENEFLEAMATHFALVGDARLVFIQRCLEANADLKDKDLADVLNLKSHIVRDNLNALCDKLAAENPGTFHFQPQQRGRWTIVKKWLREQKYPQWQQQHRPPQPEGRELDWLWHQLKERAEATPDWLNFLPTQGGQKGIVVPPPNPDAVPHLAANAPYAVRLELPRPEGYLLLLNQGLETSYVLLPSMAFAPEGRLDSRTIVMPQRGAMCDEISFDTPGREEFIGIVLRAMPELDWLQPSEAEPAPELHRLRLNELWDELQQQEWRAFYQAFEVVN